MNWYGNSNVKYASLSDDRFVEVLGQTYPQFLEAWTSYENAIKSNRIKEIIDDDRKFKKLINYTWNGKKYEFELQIANSELGPVESTYRAFARAGSFIWMNYPRFAYREQDRTFAHELAHILQEKFGRSGLQREITKGGKLTGKTVDYMYRFYEIHARWTANVYERMLLINLAYDKVKNSELIKKDFALNNGKELNNIKKKIIAYLFHDVVANPWKEIDFLSMPSYLHKNFENSDATEMLRYLMQNEMRARLIKEDYFIKTIDPRVDPGSENAYYGNEGANSPVRPKDKNIKNYLNKLKVKYIAVSETYMIKKYNELVSELVGDDDGNKKSILQSRKREAEISEVNNEVLREVNRFNLEMQSDSRGEACKAQFGEKISIIIAHKIDYYRELWPQFPYMSYYKDLDRGRFLSMGGSVSFQLTNKVRNYYKNIVRQELMDFSKKMNYDENATELLYSNMWAESNNLRQKILSQILNSDPVWVKNAPYYHNPKLLKNFSQNEDIKIFMNKVAQDIYYLFNDLLNKRIKNKKKIGQENECILFYLLSKNKNFHLFDKENAMSFILENIPWEAINYNLIKESTMRAWEGHSISQIYNMAEKAIYLKPDGEGLIDSEIRNWAKNWLESKGEKIVQKANQKTEIDEDKPNPLKRIWDVFRGRR